MATSGCGNRLAGGNQFFLPGAQGGPGGPGHPQGSYPSPFSAARRGKEALLNLESPVTPPPSRNVSPGPARDSASRPHPRASHPSCESMHQLPGWQPPPPRGSRRGSPAWKSSPPESAAHGLREVRWGCSISGGDSCPGPTHPPRGPTRIPGVKTPVESPIASPFHPTQTRSAMEAPRWV